MLGAGTATRRRGAIAFAVAVVVIVASFAAIPATVPAAGAATERASRGAYERTIRRAVADIQDYWSQVFPVLYGEEYEPLPRSRVIAGRPGVGFPRCQGQKVGYRDVAGNAFYCYRDNFIAYDDVKLFPDLHERLGPFAVALVLAHEWGHAVQDRAGAVREATIYKELQADCFAGAWTAYVANGYSTLEFRPGDLEVAILAMLEFRDAPGSSPDDPSAHGSAFDRLGAFQDGFQEGAPRCANYFVDPPVVVQLPFLDDADAASGGDVPASEVIPLAVELLNDFYGQVEPAYVPLTVADIYEFDSRKPKTIARCGRTTPDRKTVENRVYYCIDDDYLAFDQPFLQRIYDEIGDFGVATLLANPWATRVQTIQGVPGVADNTLEAVLQADCYTGGWAAAFFNGVLDAGSLSPGDLDEFVMAFLVYSRARGVSADVPITFVRVRFFREGFFSGYRSCGYDAIADAVARL